MQLSAVHVSRAVILYATGNRAGAVGCVRAVMGATVHPYALFVDPVLASSMIQLIPIAVSTGHAEYVHRMVGGSLTAIARMWPVGQILLEKARRRLRSCTGSGSVMGHPAKNHTHGLSASVSSWAVPGSVVRSEYSEASAPCTSAASLATGHDVRDWTLPYSGISCTNDARPPLSIEFAAEHAAQRPAPLPEPYTAYPSAHGVVAQDTAQPQLWLGPFPGPASPGLHGRLQGGAAAAAHPPAAAAHALGGGGVGLGPGSGLFVDFLSGGAAGSGSLGMSASVLFGGADYEDDLLPQGGGYGFGSLLRSQPPYADPHRSLSPFSAAQPARDHPDSPPIVG